MTKRKTTKKAQTVKARTTEKQKFKTHTVQSKNSDDFIMLPTVDFCFKELMRNEKVRKGIISAILGVDPEEVEQTTLLPTILRKEYEDDKYGILDVLVELKDGRQIDFEMQVEAFDFWEKRVIFYLSKMITDQIQEGDGYDKIQKCIHVSILDFNYIEGDNKWYRKVTFCDTTDGKIYTDLMEIHLLELRKLPPEDQNEDGIIRWMRFLKAKNRKEFQKMAEQDEYIGEAYKELEKISADEEKRLEYETRLKYRRDKHAALHYATRVGREEGEKLGSQRINKLNQYLIEQGRLEDLTKATLDHEYQGKLLQEFENNIKSYSR